MGLALDEPHADDTRVEADGLCFLVGQRDRSYVTGGSGVRIEYSKGFFGEGFWISPRGYSLGCC